MARDTYNQLFETRVAVGSYQTPGFSKYLGTYGETNYDLILNYDKKLTTDLTLKALLGGNVRQVDNQYTSAATAGGLVVPRLYTLSNSLKTPAAPIEYDGRKEVDGIFAGATLGWKEFLTLDATLPPRRVLDPADRPQYLLLSRSLGQLPLLQIPGRLELALLWQAPR